MASNQIGLRLPLDNHTLGNCLISIMSTFYNREKCTFLQGENEVGILYLAIISVELRNIPLFEQSQTMLCLFKQCLTKEVAHRRCG